LLDEESEAIGEEELLLDSWLFLQEAKPVIPIRDRTKTLFIVLNFRLLLIIPMPSKKPV